MVGVHAGLRHQRLDGIKTVHLVAGLGDLAALRETADVMRAVFLAADEVAIQRENHLRRREFETRRDRRADGDAGRALMHAEVHRFVHEPARLRQLLRDHRLQARAGRRVVLFEHEAQPVAFIRSELLRERRERVERLLAGDGVALVPEELRAVGIVEAEDGGLREVVRAAVAVGMLRVTLDLRRPAFVRLDDERNGAAAVRHGGGEELRDAVRVALGQARERINVLDRLAATRAEHSDARERE